VYIHKQQYNVAEPLLIDALHIREVRLGPKHSRVAQTLKHMLTLYELKSKSSPPIPSPRGGTTFCCCPLHPLSHPLCAAPRPRAPLQPTAPSRHHPELGVCVNSLCLEEYAKAAECGYRALELTKIAFGDDHFHVSSIYYRLGVLETSLSTYPPPCPLP
jgi:hypothetical protein